MNECEIYELHFCAHSHTTLHRWIHWACGGGLLWWCVGLGFSLKFFPFWGTLMKFDGLGFNFLTLKVFFLFVSSYESWDHLLCWVMFIGFLVFWGFGAWGEDGGTSQICNAVLYWVGWVYKRDWVKRWGWLFSCWVDEDIFSTTLSTTLSEVGLTLWALQWESWFKEKKPLS